VTPEQATEALTKAIADHATAHGLAHDDELLSDWAIVSAWQPTVANGTTNYLTHFDRHSQTPFHVAVGMFEVGSQLVREMGSPREGDDL
jgi:hypothetical protein